MSSTQDLRQCIALTEDGERCSRLARDGGFCYQHDESDETIDEVDEEDVAGEAADAERTQQMPDGDDQDARPQRMERNPDDQAAASAAGEPSTETDDDGSGGIQITARSDADEAEQDREDDMASTEHAFADTDIGQVREDVSNVASEIVGYPLDGIARIDKGEDGIDVAIEVIERRSIPDTQDIIGRYELQFDENMQVAGYRRTHRYRRDDMGHDV